MKRRPVRIRTIFILYVILFVALLVSTVVYKEAPPVPLVILVTLVLAFLSTTWFIPLICGKLSHSLVKRNLPYYGELVAKFGIAVGKPLDSLSFKNINLCRHITPTMSCTNFLRVALMSQGKFAELLEIDKEMAQIVLKEEGTAEGRGVTKAKLAGSMHRTGDTKNALVLVNESMDEFALVKLVVNPGEKETKKFSSGRRKLLAAEISNALFTRATILEALERFDEALPDRQQALVISEDAYGVGAKETKPHVDMLGKLYLSMQQFDKAANLLHKPLESRPQQPPLVLVPAARLALSNFYRQHDDLDKAEEVLAPALEWAMNAHDAASGPSVGDYFRAMALLRQKQSRSDEAYNNFQRAREIYLRYFPETQKALHSLNEQMLLFLNETGRRIEAEALQREMATNLESAEDGLRNMANKVS